MKMTQKSLRNSVAFALLLIAAMQVSAQSQMQLEGPGLPPFKITFSLTVTAQGGDNGGYPVDKITATTTHWTSQNLMKIAENKLGVSFPTNASLAQSYTDIVVVDAAGTNVIENLTTNGIATITISDTSVERGQFNQYTSAQTMSHSYIFRVSFDDGNGNSCNLTGFAREKYSQTAVDQLGHIKETETVSSTLIGEGSVGGGDALFTGSASSSGIEIRSMQ
jgi:hypothetical protein